jgi:hypothetical protein
MAAPKLDFLNLILPRAVMQRSWWKFLIFVILTILLVAGSSIALPF